jgi:hypothetical protein
METAQDQHGAAFPEPIHIDVIILFKLIFLYVYFVQDCIVFLMLHYIFILFVIRHFFRLHLRTHFPPNRAILQ